MPFNTVSLTETMEACPGFGQLFVTAAAGAGAGLDSGAVAGSTMGGTTGIAKGCGTLVNKKALASIAITFIALP